MDAITIGAAASKSPAAPAATKCAIPIRNIWYMLLYAWGEVDAVKRWHGEVEAAPSLDALFAEILARLVSQRLRIGLGRGYALKEQTIRGLRGRIDFAASLKRLDFQRSAAHCRFYDFTCDIPRNRLVRAVLARLAAAGQFGPDAKQEQALRQRLRRLVCDLNEVSLIEPRLETIARETLGREDHDYRLMLAICEVLLRREMPTESEGHVAKVGLDRDTLTVHKVFERFVANLLRVRLDGWEITEQKPLIWHAVETSRYLPQMRVDVLLRNKGTGRLIVLDTKCTPRSLVVGPYGSETFASSHLYQIYSYLRSQEGQSAAHQKAEGVLLYPMVHVSLAERVVLQGHPIRFETVDLTRPWPDIETRVVQAAIGEPENP
jgi:5-methylcytosine-specific restriction enzyme subunit McrC